jgi:hypothetical protein
MNFCPHGSPFFLAWHRLYVAFFEQALGQAIGNAEFRLPYWDWTSGDSIAQGIPPAFADATYTRPDGTAVPNPLSGATVGVEGDRPTSRSPDDPSLLATYAQQVADSVSNYNTYLSFNAAIEQPHNNLHVWVGGDMGVIPYAAYDPIFWCHHANVDRQWAIWQASGNNGIPPEPYYSATLGDRFPQEWNVTQAVKDVIDYRSMGYEYDDLTLGGGSMAMQHLDAKGMAAFALPPHQPKVILRVFGSAMTPESYKVHVFINHPGADHQTQRVGNGQFATTFGFFGGMKGMGPVSGMQHGGQAPAMPHRPSGAPEEIQRLDITDAVARSAPNSGQFTVKLVATDLKGKPVDLSKLPITGISIDRE